MQARAGRVTTSLTLSCVAVALLCACATPYDPFRVPATELRSRVRTIALAPLRVNADLADPARARAKIEPLVASRLAGGGFRVVPSAEMERLWRTAAADVGDLYDPVTGEIDQERYDAVEASVYHELRSAHGVDGVLWMGIYTVDLYRTRSETTFCGTTDEVYWADGKLGLLEPAIFVLASCLGVVLYDMEERELYGIRSGLEVVETFARQTRSVRPVERRLADPARLQQAVEATVGPLADGKAGR